jgi:hypothetical protein
VGNLLQCFSGEYNEFVKDQNIPQTCRKRMVMMSMVRKKEVSVMIDMKKTLQKKKQTITGSTQRKKKKKIINNKKNK